MDNSETNGCLIFGLIIVASIIIGALVYLGGGWITYDIYRSFDPVETSESLKDVEIKRFEIYAYVVIGYYFLLEIIFGIFDEVKGAFWIAFIPIIIAGMFRLFLPISVGSAILNSIICIGICAFATYHAIIRMIAKN